MNIHAQFTHAGIFPFHTVHGSHSHEAPRSRERRKESRELCNFAFVVLLAGCGKNVPFEAPPGANNGGQMRFWGGGNRGVLARLISLFLCLPPFPPLLRGLRLQAPALALPGY